MTQKSDVIIKNINKYLEDNKIWVDSEAISKDKLDLIAQKILKNCNYTTKKNQNNNTNLKIKSGKLMCTSGLSVNDFSKKHNF